jgi:hypothetical protein
MHVWYHIASAEAPLNPFSEPLTTNFAKFVLILDIIDRLFFRERKKRFEKGNSKNAHSLPIE